MVDKRLTEAVEYVKSRTRVIPKLALVLGSGLGDFANTVNVEVVLTSEEIPNYPVGSVKGHAGKVIVGTLEDSGIRSLPFLLFQGRVHYYETGDVDKVVFPISMAHKLGARTLIATNAAGGINSKFEAGQLMLITDYLNFARKYPSSVGKSLSSPKHSPPFDPGLQDLFRDSARDLEIGLQEGTYCWLHGPSYETAAEIRMLSILGADAVGMSTVPEILHARSLGMKTAGISLISNLATGLSATKLTHEEVTETANKIQEQFTSLLKRVILRLR